MDNSLVVQLGMNIQSLEAGLNKSYKLMENFNDKITEVAKSLGAAFAVERITEFGIEAAKLAGQTDGVKRVFDQIKGSADALHEMTKATQGTVSQLNLMKYAVQADNFNIPIEQMGKLFDFAHQRALATGQSVDYLVQSIVTGIGRKSPLILDNLGISAVTLREKLKGVGTETASVADVAKVVGEIATESINKFGLAAETTASKMEAINASWENFKVAIGKAIEKTGILNFLLNHITTLLNDMSNNTDAFEKMDFQLKAFNDHLKDGAQGANYIKTQIESLTKKAKDAGYELHEVYNANGNLINVIATKIKATEENNQADKKSLEIIKNIDFYEKEIKDLREQEGKALGDNLTKIQATIEAEQAKLDILKLQYQIQRDAANTSTLGKMAGFDTSVSGIGQAKTNILPPAENLNKANSAIQKSIDLLNKLNHQAPSYVKSFDDIFDEKKIRMFAFALNSGVQSMVTDLAIALGSFASGAASSDQIFATLLTSVGNMAIQLGQLAIGAGIAIEAIQTALTSLEGPVAIAAGVALVALGSAVKGAAANIAKGGSGGGRSASNISPASNYSQSNQPIQVIGSTQIKGQDLWVIYQNYQTNSGFTRIG